MAKGDPLPDEDHVLRGCGNRGIDGSNKVTAAAFELRRGDKQRLSTDWVECRLAPVADNQDEKALKRLGARLSRKQKVCKLNVGEIRRVSNKEAGLDVLEDGSRNNPCHSVITGLTDTPADVASQKQLAELANRNKVFTLGKASD